MLAGRSARSTHFPWFIICLRMNLTPGTKLGPYEVVGLLGAGGMGEVYRARDSRLKREVAIKVLPQALSLDSERLHRFEQEALATAALNHPNILSVFDIGTNEGSPYVVSELLEGETLRERLRSGALSGRKALDYALQIAHGLAAAHEKGIIHRDLKPDNLFITKDGRVKILDFGLAKLTQPDASQASMATMTHATDIGVVMGTAGYMSPEQVRGVALDARSDIFSFGAILYEMLSGKRAFHGDTTADTMSSILKEDPPELSETNRNVSPALDRIVQHCLEKSPEARFHSASDIAFDLEHISGVSGSTARVQATSGASPHNKLWIALGSGLALAALMFGLGWWLGRGSAPAATPEYKQITFRTGPIGKARFTPDGSIVYSASWDGTGKDLYLARTDDPGARALGLKDAELLSISKNGELAIRTHTVGYGGYSAAGTLARVPLSGGMPREMLDYVQDADWAADGERMAVVRYAPENQHWRLEFPIGRVLFDSTGWISTPKISPDEKWVAFADHEVPGGDDQGSVAVIAADGSSNGKDKKLSSGWTSIEGILWSPAGNEVWFTSSGSGVDQNPRAVGLSGKVRTVTNVPGGMWLEDLRGDTVLAVVNQARVGIHGLAPGEKQERELGWFGWSELRDMTSDGHKILFEEEGDGGGANYTIFLRDTDGSPPTRLGEGLAMALSADAKWAITRPAKGGNLNLVPTGAGAAKALTHDNISYTAVEFLPDNQQVLAAGIEDGHGARDYLIDLANGDSKAITPEGISGVLLTPDGKATLVRQAGGKVGIWPLDGSGVRLIPGLGSEYRIVDWSPDGKSLYVHPTQGGGRTRKLFRVDVTTGKMEFWKNFGPEGDTAIDSIGRIRFSRDGTAYAYIYVKTLSRAFVVTGLK